eukprot:903135-Prorocentrum_minimum.AAC.1
MVQSFFTVFVSSPTRRWRGLEGVRARFGGVWRGSVLDLEGSRGGPYTIWRGQEVRTQFGGVWKGSVHNLEGSGG